MVNKFNLFCAVLKVCPAKISYISRGKLLTLDNGQQIGFHFPIIRIISTSFDNRIGWW